MWNCHGGGELLKGPEKANAKCYAVIIYYILCSIIVCYNAHAYIGISYNTYITWGLE